MDATTLATEATRYLETIDLFRSLELNVKWRSEADEVGALSPPPELQRPPRCERCAGPLVWMNGPAEMGGTGGPAQTPSNCRGRLRRLLPVRAPWIAAGRKLNLTVSRVTARSASARPRKAASA